jgi:oligoribonuclease NrnB/cAMP/cGMP phosphodiesterase (DHH superfamily)
MILHISHTDLDGIGCQTCVIETFPDEEVSLRNISYIHIEPTLNILSSIAGKYSKVFITDLMFKNEKYLITLQEISNKYPNVEFYFFDHHNYDFNIKKYQTKNLIILHTNKMSASKITFLACKKKWNLENSKLERFIEHISAYDIFDRDSIFFEKGFKLFRLTTCEKYRFQNIVKLIDDMIASDYLLFSEEHEEMIKNKIEENKRTLEKYKNSGGIIFEKNCVAAFSTNEYIIDLIREEYEKDYDIFINMTLFGRGSVRLSDSLNTKEFDVKSILEDICKRKESFKELDGHEKAFGILFDKNHESYKKDIVSIVQEFFKYLK